jgi:hypothetical protein
VMRGVGAAAEEMLARAISEATNAKVRKLLVFTALSN